MSLPSTDASLLDVRRTNSHLLGGNPHPYAEPYNESPLSKSGEIRRTLSKAPKKETKSRSMSVISTASEKFDETVERKRRDNINGKIQELLNLIPHSFFTDEQPKATGTKDGKPNKGQILTKGVDYIVFLQNAIDENNRKEVELQMKIRLLEQRKLKPHEQPSDFRHTIAEQCLAEIGVGPLAEQGPPQPVRRLANGSMGSTSANNTPNSMLSSNSPANLGRSSVTSPEYRTEQP